MLCLRPQDPNTKIPSTREYLIPNAANTLILSKGGIIYRTETTKKLPTMSRIRKEHYIQVAAPQLQYRATNTPTPILLSNIHRWVSPVNYRHTTSLCNGIRDILERHLQKDTQVIPQPQMYGYPYLISGAIRYNPFNGQPDNMIRVPMSNQLSQNIVYYHADSISKDMLIRYQHVLDGSAWSIYMSNLQKERRTGLIRYSLAPTIGCLSNMLYDENRILYIAYIKTLLAMGIRWHPSYVNVATAFKDHSEVVGTLQPTIYPLRHRHEVYYQFLRKVGLNPILFDPYTMIACDAILILTMCLTVGDMYLPPELRILIVQHIDMLAILPSVNSVTRYLYGCYY